MIYEVEAQFLLPVWRRRYVLAESEEAAVEAVNKEVESDPDFWNNAHEDNAGASEPSFRVVCELDEEEGYDLQA